MTKFSEARELTRSILAAAAPYVTDTTAARPMVHVDNGLANPKEELCLKEIGYYATVLPILDGDLVNQGGKAAVVDVAIPVRIAIKPGKNRNVEALLEDTKGTLLSWDPNPANPANRFKLAEMPFVVDDSDPGEFAYILFFVKRVVF